MLQDPRDFHALERTYLAFVRTATSLSLFGVVIAQLFVISDVNTFVGIMFASIAYTAAILTTTVACVRYFRQQRLMVQGRTVAAGVDLMSIWLVMVLLYIGLFIAVLAYVR